jgi:hypothetical protein
MQFSRLPHAAFTGAADPAPMGVDAVQPLHGRARSSRRRTRGAAAVACLGLAMVSACGSSLDITASGGLSGPVSTGTPVPTTSASSPPSPAAPDGVAWADPAPPRGDVLLVGDSLLYALVPTLTATLADRGVTTHVAGGPGTGLLSGQMDWISQIQTAVDLADPEVVVIEACCNYGATPEHPEYDYRLIDGSAVVPDSSTMFDLWAQAADQAVEAAAAGGAQVLWVIAPPVPDDHPLRARIERFNRIARHLVDEHPDLGYVDWERALTGLDGGLVDPVPLDDGTSEPLRVDNIHLGPAADARVAAVTLDGITAALVR